MSGDEEFINLENAKTEDCCMNTKDPKFTALLFNEAINNQDIESLMALLTENHRFIDSENTVQTGTAKLREIWTDFFRYYPDYRNYFSTVRSVDEVVTITGYTICLFKPLEGDALWRAVIENDKIAEWAVFTDTLENRKKLNIPQ